ICLEALKAQSLLPTGPAPIRIERFVEKHFKTATDLRRSWSGESRLHDFQFFGHCRGDPGVSVLGGTEYNPGPQKSSLDCRARSWSRSIARTALHGNRLTRSSERC